MLLKIKIGSKRMNLQNKKRIDFNRDIPAKSDFICQDQQCQNVRIKLKQSIV